MISSNLTRLDTRLNIVLSPLTVPQTQLPPPSRPNSWSIQQIAEHLLLTYQLTCSTFAVRLAKATPTKATPTLTQRLGQLMLLNFGYFPRGRKAPPAVCPPLALTTSHDGSELTRTLTENLTHMDALIAQAETLFGPHTRAVSHQVLGPLTSRQWARFHLVHGLHHLAQVERILKP